MDRVFRHFCTNDFGEDSAGKKLVPVVSDDGVAQAASIF